MKTTTRLTTDDVIKAIWEKILKGATVSNSVPPIDTLVISGTDHNKGYCVLDVDEDVLLYPMFPDEPTDADEIICVPFDEFRNGKWLVADPRYDAPEWFHDRAEDIMGRLIAMKLAANGAQVFIV